MSAFYTIEGNLVRMQLVGSTSPGNVMRCVKDFLGDPACPPVASLLMDVTESTSLGDRTPDQIRSVVHFLSGHAAQIGGRCAFLVSSDAEHDMVRLGGAYGESVGLKIRGFHHEAAALRWLGVT